MNKDSTWAPWSRPTKEPVVSGNGGETHICECWTCRASLGFYQGHNSCSLKVNPLLARGAGGSQHVPFP